MSQVNLKCRRIAANAGPQLEQGRLMYLGMMVSKAWIQAVCDYWLLDKGLGGSGKGFGMVHFDTV